MFCPRCGNVNPDNAVACVRCGSPMPQAASYVVCPYCGNPIYPSTAICPHCHVVLNPQLVQVQHDRRKSKLAAGLLGIFLGAYGVHNFYLGNIRKAVTQLVLTVATIPLSAVSLGLFGYIFVYAERFGEGSGVLLASLLLFFFMLVISFAPLASAIWGLVEGILLLTGAIKTDGHGVPLKD